MEMHVIVNCGYPMIGSATVIIEPRILVLMATTGNRRRT
jgi:hypothetical protein